MRNWLRKIFKKNKQIMVDSFKTQKQIPGEINNKYKENDKPQEDEKGSYVILDVGTTNDPPKSTKSQCRKFNEIRIKAEIQSAKNSIEEIQKVRDRYNLLDKEYIDICDDAISELEMVVKLFKHITHIDEDYWDMWEHSNLRKIIDYSTMRSMAVCKYRDKIHKLNIKKSMLKESQRRLGYKVNNGIYKMKG